MKFFERPSVGANWVPLLVALWIVAFNNLALWHALSAIGGPVSGVGLCLLVGLVLVALVTLLLQLFNMPWLLRAAASAMLLFAALSSFSIDGMGVPIDVVLVRSLVGTDASEIRGYLSPGLVMRLSLLWLLPSLLLCWLRIRHTPVLSTWVRGAAVAMSLLLLALAMLGLQYRSVALTARSNHELRMLMVPTYPLYAFALAFVRRPAGAADADPAPPRAMVDARRTGRDAASKPLLFVLVVGETARAMQFSLNGYRRPTNPALARLPVLSFSDVTACGTSTAASLPCMFGFGAANTSPQLRLATDLEHSENLLDLLQRLGVGVAWVDNNSGCEGVCARVPYASIERLDDARFCNERECFDGALLSALQRSVAAPLSGETIRPSRDRLLVLHMHGSHGPDYANRVPPSFQRFRPLCTRADVAACTNVELVNAYDNTILYTDHVLAALVHALDSYKRDYDAALLYVSDHGESLGEHGVFLHGFPYALAPREQLAVPLILWLSSGFHARHRLRAECVRGLRARPTSHAALLPTILAAFDVQAPLVDASLDLLAPCRMR